MKTPSAPEDTGARRFKGKGKFQRRLVIIPTKKSMKNKPKSEVRKSTILI